MIIKLNENIRKFRKKRGLTQENLAEAMGVTVGAVSKWEAGLSAPEITLIAELANFFETSVDVLLGYELESGKMSQSIKKIKGLTAQKCFDEAGAEAEKALQKYPNSFDMVYSCATLYYLTGLERDEKKALRRAKELYERALTLSEQNEDIEKSNIHINNQIAYIHLMLEESEKGLELLKKSNYEGINNPEIGNVLAQTLHRPQEAIPYLSESFIDGVVRLFRISASYANVYAQEKDFDTARELLDWMIGVLSPIGSSDSPSFVDKSISLLSAACAQICMEKGEKEAALEYLAKAKKRAQYFDDAPDYHINKIKFFRGDENSAAFDSVGNSAVEAVVNIIKSEEVGKEFLLEAWEKL